MVRYEKGMATNFVNLAGLGYDIVGAFLLGRSVVFNSREDRAAGRKLLGL